MHSPATWEIARNAESWVPRQTTWIRMYSLTRSPGDSYRQSNLRSENAGIWNPWRTSTRHCRQLCGAHSADTKQLHNHKQKTRCPWISTSSSIKWEGQNTRLLTGHRALKLLISSSIITSNCSCTDENKQQIASSTNLIFIHSFNILTIFYVPVTVQWFQLITHPYLPLRDSQTS